jgi:hypothetical protein
MARAAARAFRQAYDRDLFERSDDLSLLATAIWLSKRLLKMDWKTRHLVYDEIVVSKPHRFINILNKKMGPDQLLNGSFTGVDAPAMPIVLQDRPKRRLKQLKITDLFKKKPRL